MSKLIVLDANILIRSILGKRVPQLLEQYGKQVRFFTTDICYQEVRRHLPALLERRGMLPKPFLEAVDKLETVVLPLDEEVYGTFKDEAK